jgi:drug/metabolite transporter (DMT)-like permease
MSMPAPGPWFFYAVAAAVLWGLNYTLTERLLKSLSTATVLLAAAVGGLVVSLTMGFLGGGFRRDLGLLAAGGREAWWLAASVGVYLTANLCILASVRGSNATLAAVVESTYPLFTVIFAWVLFREFQATPGTLVGAVLIVAGVACVLRGH